MRLGKAVKILLALATAVASYFIVAQCAHPFYDSWTDIILAIASWETFGYRVTLATDFLFLTLSYTTLVKFKLFIRKYIVETS